MKSKVLSASIWSILSEIIAKAISPIGFIILTRILSPQDFGVVAVATTILSFVNIISDMGISKVIIQEHGSKEFLERMNNVGFLFNASLGLFLCLCMIIFSKKIALLLGSPKSAPVIMAMSIQVVFFSLSSIQSANRKKELNFKFLFFLRLITTGTPLLISVPIAFLGGGYWAIVSGQIAGSVLSTIVFWKTSTWKPKLFFEFQILMKMLAKSVWNTLEQLFSWIPLGLDTYLITKYLSVSDLGMYSTSRTLFSSAITLTLGGILPVLFSAFSRISDNDILYKKILLISQKAIFALAAFMGVGVFIFRDIIEYLIFNGKWEGISKIFGVIFLIMSFEYFYLSLGEGLRARGHFRITSLNTVFSVALSVPFLLIGIKYGLLVYVITRSALLYLYFPIIFYNSKRKFGITFLDCIKNSRNIFLCISVILASEMLLNVLHYSIMIENIIRFLVFSSFLLLFLYLEKDAILSIKRQFIN
jgi:O-antigen/teichoic acid export membrane protein